MTVVIIGWNKKRRMTIEATALSRLDRRVQRGLRHNHVRQDDPATKNGMQK